MSYDLQDDLGPDVFYINEVACGRIDFKVTNDRKQTIVCSMYHRTINIIKKYPCVFYCHGNCGNRTDSFECLRSLLVKDIFVVCFDFPGCGLSDGSIVTLGYYEHKDIECVMNFVEEQYDFIDPKRLALWGRSMGAVSAIMLASRVNKIRAMVLDSPFSNFSLLLEDYINRYKVIPKLAGKYIERKMREKIKERADFDIQDLSPIANISNVSCPILFLHGKSDSLVLMKHSLALFERVQQDKHFIKMEVGHNDVRPNIAYEKIQMFLGKELCGEDFISLLSNPRTHKLSDDLMDISVLRRDSFEIEDKAQTSRSHNVSNRKNSKKYDEDFKEDPKEDQITGRSSKRKLGIVPIQYKKEDKIQDMRIELARLEKSSSIEGNIYSHKEIPVEANIFEEKGMIQEEETFEKIDDQSATIPQRTTRRSKLFIKLNGSQEQTDEYHKMPRTDSSNFGGSPEPHAQISKRFSFMVQSCDRPVKRKNVRRKIFFKFPVTQPQYVMESDIPQLLELDKVFSEFDSQTVTQPSIDETNIEPLPYSARTHEVKISASKGDFDSMSETEVDPSPKRST